MADQPTQMSPAGLVLITFYEGIRTEAYQDSVGVWTIGVGHTSAAGPPEVYPGMTITVEEAFMILQNDIGQYEKAVNDYVTVDLNQPQYDALVSWTYNLGPGNLAGSTMLKVLNSGDYWNTIHEMLKWDNASGEQLRGLTRRRGSSAGYFMMGNSLAYYEGVSKKPPDPDEAYDKETGKLVEKIKQGLTERIKEVVPVGQSA